MECVRIPLAVLESKEYQALTPKEQILLVQLYALNHDCERFTIDLNKPELYLHSEGAMKGLKNRIVRLIETRFLIVEKGATGGDARRPRVFRFKYMAEEFAKAA